ncbi:hypothetical protein IAI10_20795 [Clostridium sp. 19966]|uniref:tetratricopeptide repeat protein n=1 Tax=Clostridium sp. 19966 TaxID=2768166 RepID=UPI0028DDEDEB|nr:hypothetical protein [Clostridium sp. 19966]MDT8719091.1 hypothetical protein [Clostridium sp. 19966]
MNNKLRTYIGKRKKIINKVHRTCLDIKRLVIRKKILSICILVAIAVLGTGTYLLYKSDKKISEPAVNITSNDAEKYFYAADYSKAIEEYNKLFCKDKANPLWLIKIAEVYSVKGDIENSNKYEEEAIQLKNKNKEDSKIISQKNYLQKDSEVANYIIFTSYMNKDFTKALQYGDNALKEFKTDKKIIKTMIPVYMANGEKDKAKSLIDNYPLDKTSSFDTALYASLELSVDNWDSGLKLLKDAWYISRDEYKVFDVLAQMSAYNKDELLEKITDIFNKNPDEPAYKMWLAKIYSMRQETTDLAQKYLDDASKTNIGTLEKVLVQASIYENSNQIDKANSMINALISSNSDDYRILHTAAWFYLEKKDYDEALKYCKMSIVKNKQYADNYGMLMPEILKAMDKSGEGEPYFRTALYIEPYNSNIMNNLANYYWNTAKNTDKALEYFNFAEIVRPADPEIKYNISMINISNNKFDEAINKLNECMQIDATVPKYHRTLGTIYMQQQKYDLAIKEIRNAYQSDNNDIMSLNNAGCYYIIVENNLDKGLYNIQKAKEGIANSSDEYTKNTINDNYSKVQKLIEQYKSSPNNTSIKLPDFVLFY